MTKRADFNFRNKIETVLFLPIRFLKKVERRLFMKKNIFVLALTFLLCFTYNFAYGDENPPEDEKLKKIKELEAKVKSLIEEINALKSDIYKDEERLEKIETETFQEKETEGEKITFGGYGDIHANFYQGKGSKYFDFHRLVLYIGLDLGERLKFNSETELEHAVVGENFGGELTLEQAYIDFLLSKNFNIRAGRVLTPVGIINKKHEPPTFLGVERPVFDTYIIPTTWSSDGVGIFGNFGEKLSYELYLVGGLDGSKFSDINGIRGGRILERAGLNEPNLTGRIDFFPLIDKNVSTAEDLRLGVSFYGGGLDNGNKGMHNNVSSNIKLLSLDFETTLWNLGIKGATAYEWISRAETIGNGTAKEIFGYTLEAGYHFFNDTKDGGGLRFSEVVPFIRYDKVDTQHKMPLNLPANPYGKRTTFTLGVNLYLNPSFVLKADYQWHKSKGEEPLTDVFNLGIGFQF